MLNPNWYKYNYERDLKIWKHLDNIYDDFRFETERFFETFADEINHLYNTYYVTSKGYQVNPTRNVTQKFQILRKSNVFYELQQAVEHMEFERIKKYEEDQLKEESLETRLEREKETKSSIYLSKRDF